MMLKGKKLKSVSNTLNNIKLSGVIKESIVDGPGFRYVIFTQGCKKRCFMCHNAETQPLDGGYEEKLDNLVLDWQNNPLLQGITISGGEPFLQPEAVLYLMKKAKETNLDVLVYSGYYIEDLRRFNNKYVDEIFKVADYLIDGEFEFTNKDLNLLFRGSSNQRIIDLNLTNERNELVIINNF